MGVSLEDLDLFPTPSDPRPGAPRPRACTHPRENRFRLGDDGDMACGRCGKQLDPDAGRRGRNNRARGGREELEVARLLDGRKVGPLGGPHDVEVAGYMRIQCKRLDRWPSMAQVIGWLDAMAPHDDIRAVSLADTPGPGGRTRRLLVVDLDEFARWHGRGGNDAA